MILLYMARAPSRRNTRGRMARANETNHLRRVAYETSGFANDVPVKTVSRRWSHAMLTATSRLMSPL